MPEQLKQLSRDDWATAIAIIFHMIGLLGIIFLERHGFIELTPYNLLLSFGLLWWTRDEKDWGFILFLLLAVVLGLLSEVIGVNTGKLFGAYEYGRVLGPKFMGVPLVIGINWFVITYGCGILASWFIGNVLKEKLDTLYGHHQIIMIALMGSGLAVAFDWLLEPVAIKLGFWTWIESGSVPAFNYMSWFLVSLLILMAFHVIPFDRKHPFALRLFIIQIAFFLVLWIALP